jgi:large subunit ribosomal protein L19
MANVLTYKDNSFNIGDTITIDYKIKEGEKFRIQQFAGILLKIRGMTPETRMITVRKMSKAGIGVERIIPVASPFIDAITLTKKSNNKKARVYYVRELSDKKLRRKLYHAKPGAVHVKGASKSGKPRVAAKVEAPKPEVAEEQTEA